MSLENPFKNNRLFEITNKCSKCITDYKKRTCFSCSNKFCKNHIFNYLILLHIFPYRRDEFKNLYKFTIRDGEICKQCFLLKLKSFVVHLPYYKIHPKIKCYFEALWEHYKLYRIK